MREETLEKMKLGDEDAFKEFAEEYQQIIFAYAITVLRDRETSEEVTQKTMIRVYEKVSQLKDLDSFIYWLFKTTYRMCLDELKMKDKRHEVAIDNQVLENYTVHYDKDNNYSVVWDALDELSDKSRFVIVGKYVFDLTEKEIASAMSLPTGTVKSRIYYAKEEFKDILSRRDIRHAHLSVVLSPGIIKWAMDNITYTMSPNIAAAVPNIPVAKAGVIGELGKTTKLMAAGVGVIGLGTLSYLALKLEPAPVQVPAPVVQACVVEDVTWDEETFQQEIEISAKLSCNTSYQILIDGKETNQITSNGEHTIEILHEGKVIESRKISVDNVDLHAPVIVGSNYDIYTEQYTIQVQDLQSGLSGVLEFYENGQQSQNFVYDSNSGIFVFPYQNSSMYNIRVFDNAGNVLDFNVSEQ